MNKLSLDHKAVAALFPPGSEAELTLTNAVVNEFVKKALLVRPNLKTDIMTAMNNARTQHQKTVDEAVASAHARIRADIEEKAGIVRIENVAQSHGFASRPTAALTPGANSLIREEVRKQVEGHFTALVEERVAFRLNQLQESETISRMVDARLKVLLETELGARVKALFESLNEGPTA
jgi:hypothetical protein